MAGHSKWANIKRKKGIIDQKRGAVFAKLSRLITIAVIEGGGVGDPDANVRLRLMIEKARYENMPKENIQRAIDKGMGPNREQLIAVMYEGFGPGGTAILIKATTDNTNRTLAELRNMMERNGGKLGSAGTVNYLFEHCASASFLTADNSIDDVFAFAEKVDASDIVEEEDIVIVYFPFDQLGKIKDYIGSLKPIQAPDEEYKPVSEVQIASQQEEEQLQNLIDLLENHDDVQSVYTNASFSNT